MKIAIWWNIPCKSIVPVARELANIGDNEVYFISQSDLSENRKKLGWELPDFGDAKYIVLKEYKWKESIEKLLDDTFDIHIFNGVYYFKKIRYALDKARKKEIPFGVISEAYHNPYQGIKYYLKNAFTRTITPLRVFPRIKKALFVMGASGNNYKPFKHLGWAEEQFFPFGYFPENGNIEKKEKLFFNIPRLLCTGYITTNKGQHLLVKALAFLSNENIPYNCTITGFGPEEENIKNLAKELGIINNINFTGVVSEKEMNIIKENTDLLVAPGIEEPWGIRINESLLAHTPVIVSDKIGACELIKKSSAGCLFKSGDLSSLKDALSIQLQPKVLQKSTENATDFAENISPKSAAHYLNDVIKFKLNKITEKPFPKWL